MTARATAVFDLLAAIRRQARAWIVVESLALLVLTLVAAGWAAFGFDRLVEPPAWVRVGLVVGTTVALGRLAVVRLVLRLARPLSDESLALAVERAHPGVDRELLRTLADLTAGAVIEAGDAATLPGRLAGGTVETRRQVDDDIWDTWPVLALLVGLYCADIAIRRLSGLS